MSKAGLLAALWLAAAAPRVEGAWVRASLPDQSDTAAYLTITAGAADALVGVQTPVASMAMLHASMMHDGIAGMTDVDRVDLPAGHAVALAPRGTHIMLMDVRRTLREGDTVTMTLRFAHAAPVVVQALVRRTAP